MLRGVRSSRRSLLWALLALSASGCLAPTLPLPPPAPPDVEQVGQGQYRMTGAIPKSGFALVMNERTRVVAGQETDAYYDFVMGAEPGDPMQFWYVSGLTSSETVGFMIPGTPADAGTGGTGPQDASGN